MNYKLLIMHLERSAIEIPRDYTEESRPSGIRYSPDCIAICRPRHAAGRHRYISAIDVVIK